MTNTVFSLVSIGAHPTSGRPRRAEQDARAVELGLQLAGDKLQVLHAGDVSEPTLRSYLGMGLPQLQVLEQPAGADALPVLSEYLRDAGAQVVLTGSQAETGEGSGMLPFLLAEQLGWPLIVGLAQVESIDAGVALVLQALPGLLGGMAVNASNSEGADALASALKKHEGAKFKGLDSVDTADGKKIVKHVLGDKQDAVAQALARRFARRF